MWVVNGYEKPFTAVASQSRFALLTATSDAGWGPWDSYLG